jgi:cold shock CspA family protein
MTATVSTVNTTGGYMHVVNETHGRVFVHVSDCSFLLADCQMGDVVDLTAVVDTPKGLRGQGVFFVERPSGERIEGIVTSINGPGGYCFVRADDGVSVFCHCRNFEDCKISTSATFHALRIGDRLSVERVPGVPGPKGAHIRRASV